MKAAYTTQVTVTGGRDGHARSSDGALDLKLSLPKELGGSGAEGSTNPEQLFAAGYAACFQSAVRAVAAKHKRPISESTVAATVAIGPRDAGGFQLGVKLEVSLKGIERKDAEEFVRIAHEEMCPYSHATRGNVEVEVRVV